MIPLSVVDARIKELWDYIDKNYVTKSTFYPTTRIEELERIKKEAIPTPEPLEQKIKARIAELEKEVYYENKSNTRLIGNEARIDELRKLL